MSIYNRKNISNIMNQQNILSWRFVALVIINIIKPHFVNEIVGYNKYATTTLNFTARYIK